MTSKFILFPFYVFTWFHCFRASFENSAPAIMAFITLAIAETNQGYDNSKVPIKAALKCIVDSTISSVASFVTLLNTFTSSTGILFITKINLANNLGILYFFKI